MKKVFSLVLIALMLLTVAASAEDTIKIGLYGTITGTNALAGEMLQKGAELAIDQVNAAGGINGAMLELVPYDDQSTPEGAVKAVTRLVDVDEVAAITERDKLKYNQFATVGTLTYLKNAGRVKAGAAFFGNIIGIKPIIISDVKGNNYAYKKVRGRKAALEEIAQSVVDNAVEPEKHWLAIDNADCEEDAKAIISMIEAKGVKFARYFMNPLGPILGASCGPQTIIAYFYGKEVTILGE